MYEHILLAIDGSQTSKLALNEALKFAKAGSKLTAIMVVDNPLTNYGYETPSALMTFNFDEAHAEFRQQAENILKETEREAEQLAGVKIHTCLVDLGFNSNHEDIASAIEKAAVDYHADLLVIGTHGRRGFQRFYLGSIAEQVVRHSRTPVLLIRGKVDD